MAKQAGNMEDQPLSDSVWSWMVTVVAVSLVLLWPAWYNGQPILFPDSFGYERAGAVTLNVIDFAGKASCVAAARNNVTIDQAGDGVSTARSPYYGVPLTLAIDVGGVWAVAILQALGVATALLMAMRRLRMSLPIAIATALVLAIFGGLAVFTVALMPDIFLGLLVLGFAMLLAIPRLPRVERLLWLLAIVVSMLFHKAFLAVGIVLTTGAILCARRLLLERATVLLLAGCCIVGVAGHELVDVSVRQVTGRPPLSVPFLLARYAASPVLTNYLRENCSPPHFVICRYRSRLPMAPDEFLWGLRSIYVGVPYIDRQAIASQANTVLRGAVAARPVGAAMEAAHGAIAQLFTVGMGDFALGIPASTAVDARLAPAMTVYPKSAIARGTFPFQPLGALEFGLYLIGGLTIGAMSFSVLRGVVPVASGHVRVDLMVTVLVGGVVFNGIVSGVLSGVFERYQGRIAWLLPFGAVVLWQARYRHRSVPTLPVQ